MARIVQPSISIRCASLSARMKIQGHFFILADKLAQRMDIDGWTIRAIVVRDRHFTVSGSHSANASLIAVICVGFDKYPSMPASKQSALSSSMALAVIAIMQRCPPE